jgi:uncharacterized protein
VHQDPPSPTPWLESSVHVGDSAITGRGLFATAPLAEGQVVIELGGRLVSTRELQELFMTSESYIDTVALFDDAHLILPAGTDVHYGNHSCDPNLWHAGPFAIVARRDIEAGEELTVDYGTQSGATFSMPCACGSPLCRGVVTSEDWRNPVLQEAYAGHWTPVLAGRIEAVGKAAKAPTAPNDSRD